MLVAFSFKAKTGKEQEFERLLNNPEAGRAVAKAMGATRNILFLHHGRMVRVLEFPDGVMPVPLVTIARSNPKVAEFLRALGPIVEDGFDLDAPGSLDAFNKRASMTLAFDVSA